MADLPGEEEAFLAAAVFLVVADLVASLVGEEDSAAVELAVDGSLHFTNEGGGKT